MPGMRLNFYVSLWNYAYYDDSKPLAGVLQEIASHGFGVELWPYVTSLNPYRTTIPGRPNTALEDLGDLFQVEHRDYLRAALRGMPSSWHSRTLDVSRRHHAQEGDYRLEIDTAAHLGSSVISVHYIGQDLSVHGYTGHNLDFVHSLLHYASARGVRLALETANLETMNFAVATFPDLGICLDPAAIHAHSPHKLEDFVEIVRERICFLHLYDTREGGSHYTPGSGLIAPGEWRYMLGVLRQIDYRGPAVLEIRPPPEKRSQTPIEAALEARAFFEGLE